MKRVKQPRAERPKLAEIAAGTPAGNGSLATQCDRCLVELDHTRRIRFGGSGLCPECETIRAAEFAEDGLVAKKCLGCGDAFWTNITTLDRCPKCDKHSDFNRERRRARLQQELPSLARNGHASREASPLSTVTPTGIAAHDPEATGHGPLTTDQRATDQPATVVAGESTFLCRFDELGRNRFNPREHFDRMELDELGARLKRDGQVQAIVVRKAPEGCGVKAIQGGLPALYEIVAGERRALAAFHAGFAGIRAEIIDHCDDARACALALAENRDRKDISQVEYARGLHKLATLKCLDPAGLAKDQGISEQHIRNLFRLLKAPAEWQQLVIDGKIDGTHLRTAAPLLHVPAIAKRLQKELARTKEKPSVDEWQNDVRSAAYQEGVRPERHVSTSDYRKSGTVSIKPNHARYAELDVVEIGNQKFALNAKLAKELLDEAETEWKKKNKSASKSKTAVDAAEKRRRAEEARRKRAEKLTAIVVLWQSWLCSQRIGQDPEDVELVLFAAATGACRLPGAGGGDDYAYETFKPKQGYRSSMIGALMDLTGEQLDNYCADAAAKLFWRDDLVARVQERHYYCQDEWQQDLARWLKRLEIDPREEWRRKAADGKQQFLGPLTEAWLALADVRELAEEWSVAVLEKDSEPEIRRKLVGNPARVMPLPAAIAALVQGRGQKAKGRKAK